MQKRKIQLAVLSLALVGGGSSYALASHPTLMSPSSPLAINTSPQSLTVERENTNETKIATNTLHLNTQNQYKHIVSIHANGTDNTQAGQIKDSQTNGEVSTDKVSSKSENGMIVHIPPSDFNPLTATDAELDYYNFPPRPKYPTDLNRWESVVSNKNFIKPEFGVPVSHGDPRFKGHVIQNPTVELER
jgi:hypothetical protein